MPTKTTATHPATGQRVGYIRVSTLDQTTARQLDGIALDKLFEDKASGKDAHRPQLQAALSYVRNGDVLVVHSMDRLARNLLDLRKIVSDLTGRGVSVEFVKEGQIFTGDDSPMAVLLLSMLGAFAEFERAMIRERQREGIAIAKAKGVYEGRKHALTREQAVEMLEKDRANHGRGRSALAKEYGISRETLYRYLKRVVNAESPNIGK